MKKIGLIGGMSWESTTVYYQMINRAVRQRLGGLHSADVLIHSCDFAEIVALQQSGDWDALADRLSEAAQALERSGAQCLAICTNTMHKVAPEVQAAVNIPLIDIRDVAGEALAARGMRKVGLLGTRYTMEQTFFQSHLSRNWKIDTITPGEAQRQIVHNLIFDELCQGLVRHETREELIQIILQLRKNGAQAIVLGCTELMLLLDQKDCPLPLFDTTFLHARALADYALDGLPDTCSAGEMRQPPVAA
jgi:aspartate racemase